MVYIIAIVLILGGGVVFYFGMRKARLRNHVIETPTSRIGSLGSGGLVEIKGKPETDVPLTTPYGNIECIYYRYKRERKEWRRSYSSSSSSRGRYTWRTIDSREEHCIFEINDGTGKIKVLPAKATFDAQRLIKQYVRAGDNAGGGIIGGIMNVASSLSGAGDERVTEYAIPTNSEIYALGDVSRRGDGLYLDSEMNGILFLSYRSEEQLVSNLWWKAFGLRILGAVIVAAGAAMIIYSIATG